MRGVSGEPSSSQRLAANRSRSSGWRAAPGEHTFHGDTKMTACLFNLLIFSSELPRPDLLPPLRGSFPDQNHSGCRLHWWVRQSRMSLKRIQTLIFSEVERVQKTADVLLICCSFICLQRRQMPSQYCCVPSLLNCNRSKRAVLYAGKWFLFISVIPLK